MSKHLRVFMIATILGLAAYGVVRALLWLSRRLGLLDWLTG